MEYFIERSNDEDYLSHYGILGMKWGVRRYQNEDGSLTEAGQKRLDKKIDKAYIKSIKKIVIQKDTMMLYHIKIKMK